MGKKRNGFCTIQKDIFVTSLLLALLPGCKTTDVTNETPDISQVVESEVREASGIVVKDSSFLIVGDDTPGTYFKYNIREQDKPSGKGPLLSRIEIDKAEEKKLGGGLALDLESVDFFQDGRIAVISERLNALVMESGIAADYPSNMAEVGGRGIEGLAISSADRIATLWEGGYFNPKDLPDKIPNVGRTSCGPLNPIVCIHDLPDPDEDDDLSVCKPNGKNNYNDEIIVLMVPNAPDPSQAFRATDLVWSADNKSIIVLLSSTDSANGAFRYKWLQRFSMKGEPEGSPLNLCDKGYLPNDLRSGRHTNFEGLGWYDKGKSLVLINDHEEPATAVVLAVSPWPVTDKNVACDE